MKKVHIDGIVDRFSLQFTERHYRRQGQLAYITLAEVGYPLKFEYLEDQGSVSTSKVVAIEEDDVIFNVTTQNTIYHFSKR